MICAAPVRTASPAPSSDRSVCGRVTSSRNLPDKQHDAFGRLVAGYYADDLVAHNSQGTASVSYVRDPARRTLSKTTVSTTTSTEVQHYRDDSDSPAFTTTPAGALLQRHVTDAAGMLIATTTPTATSFQLRDLHGDIVATASASAVATAPTQRNTYDAFGRPDNPTATYGYLGAHQRPADLPGVIQMGVRTYLPTLGRFLQVDPIEGGGANDYDYTNQDPLNQLDLDGRMPRDCQIVCVNGRGHVLLDRESQIAVRRSP